MPAKNLPEGVVDIRGKQYHTVSKRVNDFRAEHPDYALLTDIVHNGDVIVMRAEIRNPDGFVLATGFAEEQRGAGQINRTSALENCETSAIGRALANFGFGGTEYASANEVENAIHQQGEQEAARGQSGGHEVSPTASDKSKGWREPDSIYSTPSALSKAMRGLERDLHGCGDADMVFGVTATDEWKEFVRLSEKYSPHYLRGGPPAPEEFEGLLNTAERMVREFNEKEAA